MYNKIINNNLEKKLKQKLYLDTIYEDYKLSKKIIDIDHKLEFDIFINSFSENTKRMYSMVRDKINMYSEKPISAWSYRDVDTYIMQLEKVYRAETINMHIKCMRSFWRFLNRKYIIGDSNPFAEVRVKSHICPKEYKIPTHEEFMIIMKHSQRNKDKLKYALAYWNGLRADGIFNIKINLQDYTFETFSKSLRLHGKLHPECIPYLCDEEPFKYPKFTQFGKPRSAANIAASVQNCLRFMYLRGYITRIYGIHSFRHACAIRVFQETKNLEDVAAVLGHSSIAMTSVYLRGLVAPRFNSRELKVI